MTLEVKNVVGPDGSNAPYIDGQGDLIANGHAYGPTYGPNGTITPAVDTWGIDRDGKVYNKSTLHVWAGPFDTNTRANVPVELGPMAPPIKYHRVHSS